MSAKKSTNRRKAVAVGIAVVGIAGLSLASAAQLTLTGSDSALAQAGTVTVDGVCQTSDIAVSFDLTPDAAGTLNTGGSFGFVEVDDALVLTSVDADCAGKTLEVALGTGAGAQVGATYEEASLTAGVQTIELTEFGTLSAAAVESISQVSVTIHD